MPGLTIVKNSKSANTDLNILRKTLIVPSLTYNDTYRIVGNSVLFYSCVPAFIKEEKIDEFNGIIIGCDGDFYNTIELEKYIGKKVRSKLELIYYLYLKDDNKFINKINGEFNIAIYKSNSDELYIWNDRFARKPLYYSNVDSDLIVSSEKRAILSLISKKSRSFDMLGIMQLFSLNHNINGTTTFENIKKLKPGSQLTLLNHVLSINKTFLWNFSSGDNCVKRSEIIEEIHNNFLNSLKTRLKNKSRILVWLSGGYDSRSICCGIDPIKRSDIFAECYGEKYSVEIEIAKNVADILGYNFIQRSVDLPFIQIAKFGIWRNEFSIIPFEHPQISFHKEIKNKADYIISGLPGFDVLNGGHMKLGKIFWALFSNKTYNKWFNIYSKPKQFLKPILNEELFDHYYYQMENSFYNSLNQISTTNLFDKWDIFNITERQPNFSNISDLVEADLFETLHPFCDINLCDTLMKIPYKMRLFQQLSKDWLYQKFPEVHNIPYDGRGLLKNNNTLIKSLISTSIKKMKKSNQKSVIWDIKTAVSRDFENINMAIKRIMDYDEIFIFLNKSFVNQLIDNKDLIVENYKSVELIISLLFAYELFIYDNTISIPNDFTHYYNI